MVSNQQFRLKWNNHRNTVLQEFETLLHNNSFVDCTIGADGKYLKAHKIVLSACSPYLQNVFNEHFDKHPVILLKDVSFKELKCMIDYMYCGEVNISECELPSFLRTAQSLKIKGLAEDINDYDSGSDNEHPEPNSFLAENKRCVEMKMEIRDDEPPTKKSAPSLISANANNSLAVRKRKTPNSVPIAGKPNTSSLSKSLAAPNTSNSCKPAETSSSNNASGSENERITNTSMAEDCVNDVDLSETVLKDSGQNEPLEHKSKDVKEEPVDTDADEDNSSYEYNMNNPCDDSDQMNEDSESNCTNSGNKFADVSLGNVSSFNENDANDEDSGVMYFKEEVEVLPPEGAEYDEEQEEKFSLDTSDGTRNIIVEYRSASETGELAPIPPASPYPVLSQIVPTTLQKILPRRCTLSEEAPKPESKILVEKVTSFSSRGRPRKSNRTKRDHNQRYSRGYRKILPAPLVIGTTQSSAILPMPEIKSTLSQISNDPLQVRRIHQSSDNTSSQLIDCNASADGYPIYLWNTNNAATSGQVMLINSSVPASTSSSSVTASVFSPPRTPDKSRLKKNLKRDLHSVNVAQVTQNFRKIAPRNHVERR